MAGRKQKPRTSSRRGGGIWLLLALLAAAVLGLWWYTQPQAEPRAKVTVRDADYRAVTDNVQKRIDEALVRAGHQVVRGAGTEKEAPREATGGRIRWTVCDMTVTTERPIRWPLLLQTATPTDGVLTVSEGEPTEWEGAPATRYDIRLNEDPDGVDLTMVMARLYVREGGATAESERREVTSGDVAIPAAVKPHRTSAGGRGKLAIVIDDCGYDLAAQAVLESLGRPFSLAVIPGLESSVAAARQGHAAGMEIMLHLPMESMSGTGQEPTTILTSMSDSTIRQTAAEAMEAIPFIVGFNNHQGSKATSDARVMRAVLAEAQARHLFYVDSRTAATSVGPATAREMGIPTAANELFLDNSADEAAICDQLRQAIRIAQRDGTAIVIGHARASTAAAIRSMLGELDEAGVELVFVSELVG